MVDATVDNTPVTVVLDSGETYTPASGSVQKVTVTIRDTHALIINQSGSSVEVVSARSGSGQQNAHSTSMVIDSSVTVEVGAQSGGAGAYVSGFEVS